MADDAVAVEQGGVVGRPEGLRQQRVDGNAGEALTFVVRQFGFGKGLAVDAFHGGHPGGAPGKQGGNVDGRSTGVERVRGLQVCLLAFQLDLFAQQAGHAIQRAGVVQGGELQCLPTLFQKGGDLRQHGQLLVELLCHARAQHLEDALVRALRILPVEGQDQCHAAFGQRLFCNHQLGGGRGRCADVVLQLLPQHCHSAGVRAGRRGFELAQLLAQGLRQVLLACQHLTELVQRGTLQQQGGNSFGQRGVQREGGLCLGDGFDTCGWQRVEKLRQPFQHQRLPLAERARQQGAHAQRRQPCGIEGEGVGGGVGSGHGWSGKGRRAQIPLEAASGRPDPAQDEPYAVLGTCCQSRPDA